MIIYRKIYKPNPVINYIWKHHFLFIALFFGYLMETYKNLVFFKILSSNNETPKYLFFFHIYFLLFWKQNLAKKKKVVPRSFSFKMGGHFFLFNFPLCWNGWTFYLTFSFFFSFAMMNLFLFPPTMFLYIWNG